MHSSLFVGNTEVPVMQDVAISTSYSIADIRNSGAEKRNSSYTGEFEIPSCKVVDELFEYCFELNISLTTFNPNLKTPASYHVNNVGVIDGDLQLLRIVERGEGGRVYVCSLTGLNSAIFFNMADSLLTDLDFSEYDHVLNYTNVINGWGSFNEVSGVTTPFVMGKGYVYPLIDYGKSNDALRDFIFAIKDFRPALFVHEFWNKIFAAAGKTYTSNFIDGAFFKTLIIPSVENNEKVTQADKDARQFRAGLSTPDTGNGVFTLHPDIFDPAETYWTAPGLSGILTMDDDSTPPNNDASNQYNTSTGEFTVAITGTYDLVARASFDFQITPPSGAVTASVVRSFRIQIQKYNTGLAVWDTVAFNEEQITITGLSETNGQISTVLSGSFVAGEMYRCRMIDTGIGQYYLYAKFFDSGGGYVVAGSASFDYQWTTGEFSLTLKSLDIEEGLTINVNQSIPTQVKQRDFITSILNMFNLYMDIDNEDPDNYIIEPRNDFFKNTSSAINWTDKIDLSKDRETLPVGDLGFKKFTYTYKQDSDYWNQLYFDNWKEVYGYKSFETENQFVRGDNKTELIFAATPMVGNSYNTTVIPAIYKKENNVFSPFKAKIRILQWGGMKVIYNTWRLDYSQGAGGTFILNYYPYAGTADDPFFPTIDLGFGLYNELYYNFNTGFPYTLNNLFEVYHREGVRQISDKDSKIFKAYFNLTEFDIRDFDFRNPILIGTTYFYMNNIKNFNLLNRKTTQCELIKLL